MSESTSHTVKRFLVEEANGEDSGKEEYQKTLADLDVALLGMTKLSEKLKRLSEEGGMALHGPVDIPRIVVNATTDIKNAMSKVNDIGQLMGYLDKANRRQ